MHKCLTPDFNKYKYSLWIDGNTSLKTEPEHLIKYLKTDIACFRHPDRDCIYKEAEVCKEWGLADPEYADEQMRRYREEGYPKHNGLAATTYVLRRHTKEVEEFNNLWWSEICRGSKRDQLSFNYCLWKMGMEASYFPEHRQDVHKLNSFFNYKPHGI